jgi:hypothetical protein
VISVLYASMLKEVQLSPATAPATTTASPSSSATTATGTTSTTLRDGHPALNDIIVSIPIIVRTEASSPLAALSTLGSKLLHLGRSFDPSALHALTQQRDRLLVDCKVIHLEADDVLDPLKDLDVVLGDEGDGFTGSTGTSRTTYAMDVVFRVGRHVIVLCAPSVVTRRSRYPRTITRSTMGISRPLLATSVATRILLPPDLNLLSDPRRCDWLS